MKFLFSLISIGILGSAAFSQNAGSPPNLCSQKSVEDISSRGIKLGMRMDEAITMFADKGMLTTAVIDYNPADGKTTVRSNEYALQQALVNLGNDAKGSFGYSGITLIPKDKVRFEGIARYSLGFVDSVLTRYQVYYLGPKWENSEQLNRTMSGLLNLPIKESSLNSGNYSIKCGDYEVGFQMVSSSNDEAKFFMKVDANMNAELQRRSKNAEKEKREKEIKAFKP